MENKTRAIILADGKDEKWGNYKGKPKHLIEFYGKTLLQRTVDLLKANNINDIYITTHDKRYAIDGVKLYASKSNKIQADKLWACQEIWSKDTLFIWGDTFFTEWAMQTIITSPIEDFKLFCRFGENTILKSGTGEVFAFRMKDCPLLKKSVNFFRNKVVKMDKKYPDNTFTLFSLLLNLPIQKKVTSPFSDKIVIINDLTEDFDYPKDYERFLFYINNGK